MSTNSKHFRWILVVGHSNARQTFDFTSLYRSNCRRTFSWYFTFRKRSEIDRKSGTRWEKISSNQSIQHDETFSLVKTTTTTNLFCSFSFVGKHSNWRSRFNSRFRKFQKRINNSTNDESKREKFVFLNIFFNRLECRNASTGRIS